MVTILLVGIAVNAIEEWVSARFSTWAGRRTASVNGFLDDGGALVDRDGQRCCLR